MNYQSPPASAGIAALPASWSAQEARTFTQNVWLSRQESATYLGVAAKTLAQHRRDGPPYSKFFGSVRYRLSDLDSWASQQVMRR
ncbi:hypothetical protein IWX63_002927 [Arthrobacter sp. CAN_A2]|uniref:helix-turn-helix domain-containing protein n=1 Tax=Arthrobacter sp. CAN_A2 TaxID=2787718 RepID=UPI0018EFDE67